MRIVSVVGTRPQLIKAAAVWPVLRARHDEVFVDTGQHWDEALAGAFFTQLGLPKPDHSLGIGGGSRAEQLGRMVPAIAAILEQARPDAVLVYGDTNSTLAGALAAMSSGIPVAHVEAGLRSFDRRMPEETNRILTDHLARWLFAPTPAAVANLAAEGIRDGVVVVGDVMQDLAAAVLPGIRDPETVFGIAEDLQTPIGPGNYVFVTVHRAENREPAAINSWVALLSRLASPDRRIILALHPGTRAALEAANITLPPTIWTIPALGYRATLTLQLHAAAVITDSGGVQREASWLGVPCLILRSSTEWVEAVANSRGAMVVVGLDGDKAAAEMDRLAPPEQSRELAALRAANVVLEPVGAAEAIVAALEGGAG